jgi:hypothetical protein
MNEHKPCPWCLSTDLSAEPDSEWIWVVICNGCGARGPDGCDEEAWSWEVWDARVTPSNSRGIGDVGGRRMTDNGVTVLMQELGEMRHIMSEDDFDAIEARFAAAIGAVYILNRRGDEDARAYNDTCDVFTEARRARALLSMIRALAIARLERSVSADEAAVLWQIVNATEAE